tara:strand:+ start:600 stop:1568 length:969 start_codon:yes stop_codon:yes gene_type:complete
MLKIERYNNSDMSKWDKFVLSSNNGTLFHLQGFLNYHPKSRFLDHSLIIEKKGKLFSVFPAAEQNNNGEKLLVSHPGSSIGSFVLPETLSISNALAIVEELTTYAKDNNFHRITITLPPNLYQKRLSNYMDFAFFRHGFSYKKREITSILFLDENIDMVARKFHISHRRSIRKAREIGVKIKQSEDLGSFYQILKNNLKIRHGVQPTHTLDELRRIKEIYPQKVTLFGAYLDDTMIAGVVNFQINEDLLLAFYISHDENYSELRSVNLLFYSIFDWAINNNFKIYDFGIFTIDGEPNMGLGRFKENFGASGIFRDTIEIKLT